MKDFNYILNSDISDELLAAYIEGKTTGSENSLIESALNDNSLLAEVYEIACDSVSSGEKDDWDMNIPPVLEMLDMESQNIDYGLSTGYDNGLFGSDTFPSSNELYGDNNNAFDDLLTSSDVVE